MKSNLKFYSLILILNIFFNQKCLSQSEISLALNGGFILNHSQKMTHLTQSHPVGVEFSFMKNTDGNKKWHQLYYFPLTGISINIISFQKQSIGNSITIYKKIQIPIFKKNKHRCTFDLGVGPAFFTNRFNRKDNHKNHVISSTITGSFLGGISYNYHLNPKTNLMIALGINHFSNGAFKVPNLGLNVPNISVRFSYLIDNKIDSASLLSKVDLVSHKKTIELIVGNGLKEIFPTGSKKFLASNVNLEFGYLISNYNTIVSGINFFNDQSMVQEQKNRELTVKDNKRIALYFGNELILGKTNIITGFGYYIYAPYLGFHKKVYQRYGLKHYVSKNMFLGLTLKAHKGNADVLEWNLGYRLY